MFPDFALCLHSLPLHCWLLTCHVLLWVSNWRLKWLKSPSPWAWVRSLALCNTLNTLPALTSYKSTFIPGSYLRKCSVAFLQKCYKGNWAGGWIGWFPDICSSPTWFCLNDWKNSDTLSRTVLRSLSCLPPVISWVVAAPVLLFQSHHCWNPLEATSDLGYQHCCLTKGW